MKNIRINKTVFKAAALLTVVLMCFVMVYLLIAHWEQNRMKPSAEQSALEVSFPEEEEAVYYHGQWHIPKKNLTSVLMMGIDSFGPVKSSDSYNNCAQADFFALFVFDHAAQTYSVLQLNRDTMTMLDVLGVNGQLSGTITGQLALSHTYGSGLKDSCENSVRAVSRLLYGIKIDEYFALTMDAVPILNDTVGGVSIVVSDDFSGVDNTLVLGQTICLNGEQALVYVRTRLGMPDSSNLARMKRQKQYLTALAEKLHIALQDDDMFGAKALEAVSKYMVTDCNAARLSDRVAQFESYRYEGTFAPTGKSLKGDTYIEYHLDEDVLKNLVISLFYCVQPA